MKSILAAVDGSEESLAALEQAAIWAERLDAELRAIYVQDERAFVTFPTYTDSEGVVPQPIPLQGDALKRAEAQAASEAGEVRMAYERILKGHTARASLRVVRGAVERTLIAEAHGADLVVLGKRGRGLDEHGEQAGPTTETLIHEALRPVLVVPKGGHTSGPVLVPFDGSKGAQRAIVPGVRLASALASTITVLTLADRKARGEAVQAPLRDYVKPYGVTTEFRIEENNGGERAAARRILAAAEELQPGLIVMGAFSQSPTREFFLGSVTREVLNHAPCPVLMMT